jgi:hypothetical protein
MLFLKLVRDWGTGWWPRSAPNGDRSCGSVRMLLLQAATSTCSIMVSNFYFLQATPASNAYRLVLQQKTMDLDCSDMNP